MDQKHFKIGLGIAFFVLLGLTVGKSLWSRHERSQTRQALQQYNADRRRRLAAIDVTAFSDRNFQDPAVRVRWRKAISALTAEVNLSEVQLTQVDHGRIPVLNQQDFAAYRAVLGDANSFLDTIDQATFVTERDGRLSIVPEEVSNRFSVQYGQFEKDSKALDVTEKQLSEQIKSERD
jgi:hypothetical protein